MHTFKRPYLRRAIAAVLVISLVSQARQPLCAARPSIATERNVAQLMNSLNQAGKAQLQQAIATYDSQGSSHLSRIGDGLLGGALGTGLAPLFAGLGIYGAGLPLIWTLVAGALVGAVAFFALSSLAHRLQISEARKTFAETVARIAADRTLHASATGASTATLAGPSEAARASASGLVPPGSAPAAVHSMKRASGSDDASFDDLPRAPQ